MTFKEIYNKRLHQINGSMKKIFYSISREPEAIFKAMEYSLFIGGKRFRPILCIIANEIMDGNNNESMPIACAIEMIHTYSLIHDDLPAMDNDDFRRGLPSNHKIYGEGIAILAGDGLLNLAYEIMLENALKHPEKLLQHTKAMQIIANAAGAHGIVGGQALDLECIEKTQEDDFLKYVYELKTSSLITASLLAGAILENPDEVMENAFLNYGSSIGLAFQITDDILDITGNISDIGKRPGSDKENSKPTYPLLYGIEKSKHMVSQLIEFADESLNIFGSKADFLRDLAHFIIHRQS